MRMHSRKSKHPCKSSRRQTALACAALAMSGALAGVLAGCGPVPVQTHISPLPPGQQRQSTYIASALTLMPSAEVDAGRMATDPITGKTAPEGGLLVYQQNCASCHGQDGKGAGPGVPNLTDPVFTWKLTPQELYRDLLTSDAHVGRAQLPTRLDRQQLWDALYYTWTLHTTDKDVVQGGSTFRNNCSVCHGTKGRGDGNLAEGINPPPRRFVDFAWMVDKTDQRLYISISDGRPPSAMPAWKGLLSPTQRIQIIQYLRQFTYRYPADIGKAMAEQPPAS